MARPAYSLDKLLSQINAMAPGRSTASDGWIGDAAHQATPSDHNPNAAGVVCARDFTHDPAHGADMNEIAEALRRGRDPRIKYVIWNHRMFSSYPTSGYAAWEWRPYTGTNPHDHHLHCSVQPTPYLYDSSKEWNLGAKEFDEMATEAEIRRIIKEEIEAAVAKIAVGKTQAKKGYDSDKVNLKAAIEK